MGVPKTIPIRVLGPLAVDVGEGPIAINRSRERALLALLLIHHGTTLQREQIVEALWPEDPPLNPRAALQTAVSRLRSSLGPLGDRIGTLGAGYRIDLEPGAFDVAVAEQAVAEAEDAGGVDAVALLHEVEQLWRGPAYEEFRYAEFALAEVRRLEELRLRSVGLRIAAEMELGHHDRLIPELRALVTEEPFHEGLWHSLMLSLYRSGRQADALRAFQEASMHLAGLGIEPTSDLSSLEVGILQQDPALLRLESDETAAIVEPADLPRPAGAFFGRHEALAELTELLVVPGVVTITGVGGVGKTRLALELAHRGVPGLRTAPLLISVEDVPRGVDVAAAAASSLGVSPGHDEPIHGLVNWIGRRPRLVIIDGAEQTVMETARLVEELVTRLPDLRVVVTSRTPLGVQPEAVFVLDPLETGADSDAARMFADRAATFITTEGESDEAIMRIVSAVDGVPLLIELAAGRAASIDLKEIADALETGSDVSAVAPADVPLRHRSLEATVRWSWDLLPTDLQDVLARVSVFTSGFSVAVGADLCNVSLEEASEAFEALSSHSLLIRGETPEGDLGYRSLSSIRSFGRRRLIESGEAAEMRTRHAEILRDFVSTRAPNVFTDSDPGDWLPALQRVSPDLLSAFEWLLQSDAESATLMAVRLAPFWAKVQEYARGREMLESALAAYPGVGEIRANALLWLGILHIPGRELGLENVSFSHPFRDWRRRDRRPLDASQRGREASVWLRQGVDLALAIDSDELETLGRTFLGVALGELGDLEGAEVESVGATKAGAKVLWLESLPTFLSANLALARGDLARASTLARRALELEREKNDAFQMIAMYDLHARIERSRGAHEAAAGYFERALEDYARPSGQLGGVALLSMALGLSKAAAGDAGAARACFAEALSIGTEVGMPRVESAVRRGHALLAYLDGDFTQARHHLDLALVHARAIGCGDEIGSTLSRLGQVAEKAGDVPKALETYRAALRTFVPEWATPDLALALEGVAACRLKRGEHRAAAYLLGAASLVREAVQTPAEWWTSAGASAAMARLELGAPVFDAAWDSGRADHIRSVIAEALS